MGIKNIADAIDAETMVEDKIKKIQYMSETKSGAENRERQVQYFKSKG